MSKTHITRFSDSSFFDEVCVLCGTTDANPRALSGTCHVGASFRHDQHKIVHDRNSKTKIRCTLCDKTDYIDMQGACAVMSPLLAPVCEEIAPDPFEPAPVLLAMAETPYGQVAGSIAAIKYVHELIVVDASLSEPEHKTFPDELKELINKHSMENRSNTPDWILARMVCEMLDIYRNAVNERDTYHGHNNVGGPVELIPVNPAPTRAEIAAALTPREPIFPPLVETKEETLTYANSTELPAAVRHTPRDLAEWGDEKRTFMGPDAASPMHNGY